MNNMNTGRQNRAVDRGLVWGCKDLPTLSGLGMLGIALWVILSPGMGQTLSWFLCCVFVALALLPDMK